MDGRGHGRTGMNGRMAGWTDGGSEPFHGPSRRRFPYPPALAGACWHWQATRIRRALGEACGGHSPRGRPCEPCEPCCCCPRITRALLRPTAGCCATLRRMLATVPTCSSWRLARMLALLVGTRWSDRGGHEHTAPQSRLAGLGTGRRPRVRPSQQAPSSSRALDCALWAGSAPGLSPSPVQQQQRQQNKNQQQRLRTSRTSSAGASVAAVQRSRPSLSRLSGRRRPSGSNLASSLPSPPGPRAHDLNGLDGWLAAWSIRRPVAWRGAAWHGGHGGHAWVAPIHEVAVDGKSPSHACHEAPPRPGATFPDAPMPTIRCLAAHHHEPGTTPRSLSVLGLARTGCGRMGALPCLGRSWLAADPSC